MSAAKLEFAQLFSEKGFRGANMCVCVCVCFDKKGYARLQTCFEIHCTSLAKDLKMSSQISEVVVRGDATSCHKWGLKHHTRLALPTRVRLREGVEV